jgi:hypothetical protein
MRQTVFMRGQGYIILHLASFAYQLPSSQLLRVCTCTMLGSRMNKSGLAQACVHQV